MKEDHLVLDSPSAYDWPTCETCQKSLVGIEYRYDHPNHYDGISEWECLGCKIRVGRWTGKVLDEGESEPRYGGGQK